MPFCYIYSPYIIILCQCVTSLVPAYGTDPQKPFLLKIGQSFRIGILLTCWDASSSVLSLSPIDSFPLIIHSISLIQGQVRKLVMLKHSLSRLHIHCNTHIRFHMPLPSIIFTSQASKRSLFKIATCAVSLHQTLCCMLYFHCIFRLPLAMIYQ